MDASQALPQVESFLQQHADRFVDELKDLLRIPSVSADSRHRDDVRQAANYVKERLEAAGLTAELVETAGHPIVYGEWTGAPGAPTALVYGHYDVQPPDPLDRWETPPFEPTVRDGRIYARGATDDKGQMYTHIKSVEAWLQTVGQLPVNVKFVIEGEEEVGSDNLDRFLEEQKERCRCDIVVVSDTSQYAPGIPAITYGLRGIMACEVTLHGPSQDLHSGVFGGAVANPANAMSRLIASLHDDEGRVTIPGFYDDVVPLTPEERQGFADLPFDEQEFLDGVGMTAPFGEPGYSTLERRWARPTCDVNGMISGYTGEGPKTIVPHYATAKITCRLVPDQDAQQLTENLRRHLEEQCPPGLRMEFQDYHGCPAIVSDPTSAAMDAARRAIATAFGNDPVMIREGGSIPVVSTFRDKLGVDTLLLGWGQNTDNLHSPNEHFRLEDFHRGTRASARLWAELVSST
ncbi:Succinyl-diaminopimelate desuccinylase [Maioricimonas rarisocia]|uniref:Succinyl-diaminopimelate desuccinylase n=1 Tax=Maioricimonas rarisocia TaxID=2528026 RepID=A0A517Z2Z7_9PLAN|nr:dipeptidase [Maioricimonas rarisocia]QDU36872.1 Succinyl-diaminopimelate desuccinylase [Maioricimonas rarisocia]